MACKDFICSLSNCRNYDCRWNGGTLEESTIKCPNYKCKYCYFYGKNNHGKYKHIEWCYLHEEPLDEQYKIKRSKFPVDLPF